ncbi:MAG: hypothetical protein AAFY28_08860 [Actinomycetota bacterium]
MTTNTTDHPEQLELLLPTSKVSARFRLSADTRRRGLRHIAEIRKQLSDATDSDRRAA